MNDYINGPWQWECDDCATVQSAATRDDALDLFKQHLAESPKCSDEALMFYNQHTGEVQ